MKKPIPIAIGSFVVLIILWYLILANSHLLEILPCEEYDYYYETSVSGTCGIIDIARGYGSELTSLGWLLACFIVILPPAIVSAIVLKVMSEKH